MYHHKSCGNIDFMDIVHMHPDSIVILDDDNRILFANTSGLRLLHRLTYSQDYLPASMEFTGDAEQIISVIDVAGHEIVLNMQSQTTDWENKQVRFVCLADVTDEVNERRSLEKLVYTDHLTGLHNRRGLEQLAINILTSAQLHDQHVSLFYIDVNKLKRINDESGHATGDTAIIETAELLKKSFREDDIIARIGGDEFVVLVSEHDDYTNDAIIERLQGNINAINLLPRRKYALSLSIGVVQVHRSNIFHLDELLEKADRRMYAAKHKKKYERIQNFVTTNENIQIVKNKTMPYPALPYG